MTFRRALVLLLLIASCGSCLAQEMRKGPDPVVRSTAEALRAGRVTDAEKILTDAIHDLEQSEPQSPRLANYLQRLANIEASLRRPAEAAALNQRAYEIDRAAFGPSDLRITHDLLTQSMAAGAAGDSGEAERLLNQALEIVKLNSSKLDSQPNTGMAEGVLGVAVKFYMDAHRWIEADALFPEITRLCGLIAEPYRAGFQPCDRLPELLTEIRNAEGKPADTSRLPYGGNDPAELQMLNDAAKKFEVDGLYPSAEDTYTRAIAVARRIEADPKNLRDGLVVVEMNLLGQLYEKEGFKDRAEQTYLDSLRIQEGKVNPEPGHGEYAVTLGAGELVELYRKEGRLKDAESLLQGIFDIQLRSLGERHRATVQTMVRLAGIEQEEGKADPANYAKAKSIYERALAIQETNLGPDNPQLINVLAPYVELLNKIHDAAKATEVQERINRLSAAR
jgi:tetratricopeptide (TPR) repeat protein